MKNTKKIISMLLVMVLSLFATAVSAGAKETEGAGTEDKYKELLYAALEITQSEENLYKYTYLFEYNADNSPTSDEATPDYVVARIDDIDAVAIDGYSDYIVGTYHLDYSMSNKMEKSDYYIYSTAEGKAYTPHELYWAQPQNWQFALHTLEGRNYKYRGVFEDYCVEKNPDYYAMKWWPHNARGYEELYYHYETEPTCDEATPDYVLIYGFADMTPSSAYGVFGKYIVEGGDTGPYKLPYYVIVPGENGRVYTLREAFDAEIVGIDNAFNVCRLSIFGKKYWVGKIIGDTDYDREITVKDATLIQKQLAGLQWITEDEVMGYCETPGFEHLDYNGIDYISDFNRDGKRDIRDATAIQKYLVGLPY